MNSAPIEPTGSSQPLGGITPDQQLQMSDDISQIVDIIKQLQQALSTGDQTQIIELIKKLKQPLQDLHKIASSMTSQDKKALVQEAMNEFQNFSQGGNVSPTNVALLQGTCTTFEQLHTAPAGSKINVQALLDTNHLSALANALKTHMQANGGYQNDDCQELIDSMNAASSDLQYISQTGQLTSGQTDAVNSIVEINKLDFQIPDAQGYKVADPAIVKSFQNQLNELNNSFFE
jgi:hypothetical protein